MKKIALYLCLILLAACAKEEDVIPTQPEANFNAITSLEVTVEFMDCSTGLCTGVAIGNASVQLFKDDSNLGNDFVIATRQTNSNGLALFSDLDEKSYAIVVDCEYGGTVEKVNTPIGQRTYVLIELQ